MDARVTAPGGGLEWLRVTLDNLSAPTDTSSAPLLTIGRPTGQITDSSLEAVIVRDAPSVGIALVGATVQSDGCVIETCGGAGVQVTLCSSLGDSGSLIRSCDTGVEIVGSTVSATLKETIIENCSGDGVWVDYCDLLTLKQIQIRNCGDDGVEARNSDLRMEQSALELNAAHALHTKNTHADLGRFAGNKLIGGASAPFYFWRGEPVLNCGHNMIVGTGNCLLEGIYGADTPLQATYNWWGTTENLDDLICLDPSDSYQLYPICESECLDGTECIDNGTPGELLALADSLERVQEFLDSRDTYEMIPEPYPDSTEAHSALHGVYRVSLKGGLSMTAAENYFLYIADRFPGTTLAKLALELASNCKAPQGKRGDGADDFLAMAAEAENPEDSLAFVEKAVILLTEAELLGEIDKNGGTDSYSSIPVFTSMSELLLWLKRGSRGTDGTKDAPFVPTEFRLGHNYPNPFNPLTRFVVDLPVDSRIHLAVYNILGQRVRELESGVRNAGRHTLQWNGVNDAGESVASGVYLLHFTARGDDGRGFARTEKMLLVR